MIGYTLLIASAGRQACLLDYFAVLPQFRSGGRGSQILKYLREHFLGKTHQILIECEHPDFAPDRDQALRRLRFYSNAGAKKAEIETKLLLSRATGLPPLCPLRTILYFTTKKWFLRENTTRKSRFTGKTLYTKRCETKVSHLFAFFYRFVYPIRYSSISAAASRPSLIAQTTRDCPRRISPTAKTPSLEVL